MTIRASLRLLSVLVAIATVAAGCSGGDVDDIRESQKKILEQLEAQKKTLDTISQRLGGAQAPRAPLDPNKVYEIPLADSPFRGPKDAKVTLVEFSDFQCPFCARSMSFTKEIGDAFPKDLKFVYKHLPLTQIHPNAMPAAKAAVAAQNQGKFWEMHDELFAKYNQLTPDTIKAAAEKVGLDMKKFEADSASPETDERIQEDMKLAASAAVTGTPSFFLNGKRLMSRDIPVVKGLVEEELKKAK